MTDLHLHTSISHDSKESAENFILAARNAGVKCLGFSEHYDYDVYLAGKGEEAPLPDLQEYEKRHKLLSVKYPDIKLLKGIELGYAKEAVPHYNELLKERNFDYSILSVHNLKDRGDCYFPEFYRGLNKHQAYGLYLKAVLESVRADLNYQIIGHIGYIARYAPFEDKRLTYSEFSDLLDEILKEIISRNKCLELNTSTKGAGAVCVPDTDIADRYIALGGKYFTLGSDSHRAVRFMENFSAVKDYLLSRGITKTCRFENGILIEENL